MKYDFIIRGTIGSWWSGTTAEDLRYFLNRHKDEDLVIGICSPGGYVSDGLEMYQMLRDHGRVTGVAYGNDCKQRNHSPDGLQDSEDGQELADAHPQCQYRRAGVGEIQ